MLTTPIETLPGTSPMTIKRMKSLGINTYWDLINYFPFRHEDRTSTTPVFSLQEGAHVTIRGTVSDIKNEFSRRGVRIQKAKLTDATGTIALTWFNQAYIATTLKEGMEVALWGEVKKFGAAKSVLPQEYQIMNQGSAEPIHMMRLVPVYPEKHGLSSRTIREKIWHVLSVLNTPEVAAATEYLPRPMISAHQLVEELEAYRQIHFPVSTVQLAKARERLAFDELFIIQLGTQLVRAQWHREKVGHVFEIAGHNKLIDAFIASLPFELTDDQSKVIDAILADFARPSPMNRFLQGDVGSGKTAVAAVAAYATHLNGYQTLIMAPTEILAQQHYATLIRMFEGHEINIGLQTHSTKMIKKPAKTTKKKNVKTEEAASNFDIIVGTHALLNQSLDFSRVGFVCVDEQHRFGVRQRSTLKNKGINPHLLTMTATPIPRTVALTLFGELDISTITHMPANRLPIKSYVVPSAKRQSGYEWISRQIREHGDQVYIICPLIEESEIESMQTVRAALVEYERLQKEVFKGFNMGLLHGKMKSAEKQQVMQKFKDREYDILVSTSVVEVGIDVPNATIIMIEGAERFGLAQLHQLRGRVGRGSKQSHCLLYSTHPTRDTDGRLQYFATHPLGIDIAQYDLEHRGSGELYGTRQSGQIDLAMASLADLPLIERTKQAAIDFMKTYKLESYPALKARIDERGVTEIARD